MIWVILAAVGVPLWLCATGILTLVLRNRSLRRRGGDIPVRMRAHEGARWRRGHAVWVHDVLAFRGSPAAWKERMLWVQDATLRPATLDERQDLHNLGHQPVIVELVDRDAGIVQMAVSAENACRAGGPLVSREAAAAIGV